LSYPTVATALNICTVLSHIRNYQDWACVCAQPTPN
jgi:hypothetical protein